MIWGYAGSGRESILSKFLLLAHGIIKGYFESLFRIYGSWSNQTGWINRTVLLSSTELKKSSQSAMVITSLLVCIIITHNQNHKPSAWSTLGAVYFSHSPQACQSRGTKLCVCECPRAHRLAGFCLPVQPSSAPALSLAVSVRHWFLCFVRRRSQAAAVIPQCQLRALMQWEEGEK